MRTLLLSLLTFSVVTTALVAGDDAEMDKLVSRTLAERKGLEEGIVRSWLEGQGEPEIGKLLSDLLSVEVRLRSYAPSKAKGGLIAEVNAKVHKTCAAQAAAIARAYYRRQGLDVNLRHGFKPEYVVYPNKFRR